MISEIHTIDVQAHYVRVDNLELTNGFSSADAETVVRCVRDANVVPILREWYEQNFSEMLEF